MAQRVDLATQIRCAGLPEPVRELEFHPERKWRFDLAWPDHGKIAVEIQGATFAAGRHTRGKGYEDDCTKLCHGTILGWRVLWVTTQMVESGAALALIERALKGDSKT